VSPYSVADIFADPHVEARGDIVTVDDPVIGPVPMQGVYPRFSRDARERSGAARRASVRTTPRSTESSLGLTADELGALARDGVI
jgi:crotonobetainyl-CoA:carnitine CoA-transferase CaiB-like acyl-CoA transferase